MKTGAFPFSPVGLLLLLGVAAWNPGLPVVGEIGLLPGMAALWLAAGVLGRGIPIRIGVAGAIILGLIALYAWNPTHRWETGVGLLPADPISGLPGSAFPAGTWNTMGLAAAMLAAYALAFTLTERQIQGVQLAAVLGAATIALAVLAQRLEPQHPRVFEYTGIFVNENHFAVFANLILPVTLALAARARFRAVQEGRPASPAGIILLAAVLVGAAVVLCRSRAGIAVMALLVMSHVMLCRHLLRRYPFIGIPSSPCARRMGGGIVVLVAVLAVAAFAREWNHLEGISGEWNYRLGILRDTLAAWRETPWWGTGPGTFSEVFPYYQSELFRGRSILHAHCEPVQFLSEFGLLGGLGILAGAGWALGAQGRRAGPAKIPPFAELERRAFALGLGACALHGLIDFPLRIPLIAVLAATWAGIWAGGRPVRGTPAAPSATAENGAPA